MLAELDPDAGVPDPIYLASLDHAMTPEEIVFRDLLTFHRDCLNGGLDQAIFNRDNTDEPLSRYVAAYRAVGLVTVAGLVEEAGTLIQQCNQGTDVDARLEALADRYQRLTYGENEDRPDSIEASAVRFAQQHEARLLNVIDAAERGDFFKWDFGDEA